MIDAAIGETPAEPVPPVLPAPASAEPEASPPLEVAPAASPAAPAPPVPNKPVASSAEAPAGDTGEVETEAVESFDPRISIPESLGPVRRAILEGLIDGQGAMSVSQLHACTPLGTPRGTTEAGVLREYRSGRIIRTSPGHYTLAPAPPSKPTPPDPPAVRSDGTNDEQWLAWIARPPKLDRLKPIGNCAIG